MASSETFVKAAFNLLTARFQNKLISVADKLSEKGKNTPDRLREEWHLFQEEVIEEANRLERLQNKEEDQFNKQSTPHQSDNILDRIDRIREKITRLAVKVEERN